MMETRRPMVSVIMGVYNQLDSLALLTAVRSILNQTFQDFEFIIWDDGSDENTKGYLKNLPELDERIILASGKENRGLAFSLNECIKLARGKYIARMDADDISYPRRLEREVQFLQDHEEYSWVGCNAELFDESGVWGVRKMPEFPSKDDYLKFSPYIHPSVMYRASIFDKSEGYQVSEDTLRCEDYEIFMRLMANGFKGANIQEVLFEYRENDDSYKRRCLKCRFREAKCRYKNFKSLGILFPKGWIFVLRPLVGFLVPNHLISYLKHRESGFVKEQPVKEVNVQFENVPIPKVSGQKIVD